MPTLQLTYIGHASFRMVSEAGTVIYLDPWLDENPTGCMKVADVDRADIVISTHGHNDHVRDAFEIVKKTGAKFVSHNELCLVADAFGIALDRGSHRLNPGGSVKLGDVRITLVPTVHSQSLSPKIATGLPKGLFFHPDGACVGVVLAFDNGITVYDASDTGLFGDMGLIGQMYGPQIAIMPVGGKYNMDVRQAARAASLVRPDLLIPCHYGEKLGQPADIEELKRAVEFMIPTTRVAAVRPGQTVRYTASAFTVEQDREETAR